MDRGWFIGLAAATVLLGGCAVEARPGAPAATTVPFPALDATQVQAGREVYLRQCASCHGQRAEGAPSWQRADASGNLPAPPHDDTGHTWRHSDAQLAEIIRNGQRDPFNESPDLTMPPFNDQITDGEIAAVIAYFKSLWSAEHRQYQAEQNQRQPAPMSGSGP